MRVVLKGIVDGYPLPKVRLPRIFFLYKCLPSSELQSNFFSIKENSL